MVILGLKKELLKIDENFDIIDEYGNIVLDKISKEDAEKCYNAFVNHDAYRELVKNKILCLKRKDFEGSYRGCVLLKTSDSVREKLRKSYCYLSKVLVDYLKRTFNNSRVFISDIYIYTSLVEGDMVEVSYSNSENSLYQDSAFIKINSGNIEVFDYEENKTYEGILSVKEQSVLRRGLKIIFRYCRNLYFKEYPISGVQFYVSGIESTVVGISKSSGKGIKTKNIKINSLVSDPEDIAYKLSIVV